MYNLGMQEICLLFLMVIVFYFFINAIHFYRNPTTIIQSLKSSGKWALIVIGIILLIPLIIQVIVRLNI